MLGRLERHARRAVQLAHDHALGAIDHEAALRGDQRNLPHEHALLLGSLFVLQAKDHVQRRAVGLPLIDALQPVHLGCADHVVVIIENHLFVVTLDRENFIEHGLQADVLPFLRTDFRLEKLVVRIHLHLDEVWWGNDLLDLAEVNALFRFARH